MAWKHPEKCYDSFSLAGEHSFQMFMLTRKPNYLYSKHGEWKMGAPSCCHSEATHPEHVTNRPVPGAGCRQGLRAGKLHQSIQQPESNTLEMAQSLNSNANKKAISHLIRTKYVVYSFLHVKMFRISHNEALIDRGENYGAAKPGTQTEC